MKLVPKVLKDFTKTFLKGVWYGMGPDLTKRTIKSPKKSIHGIRRVVKEYPPKRKEV